MHFLSVIFVCLHDHVCAFTSPLFVQNLSKKICALFGCSIRFSPISDLLSVQYLSGSTFVILYELGSFQCGQTYFFELPLFSFYSSFGFLYDYHYFYYWSQACSISLSLSMVSKNSTTLSKKWDYRVQKYTFLALESRKWILNTYHLRVIVANKEGERAIQECWGKENVIFDSEEEVSDLPSQASTYSPPIHRNCRKRMRFFFLFAFSVTASVHDSRREIIHNITMSVYSTV